MTDLGWYNDEKVRNKVTELEQSGVEFEHTKWDRRGWDNQYTSTDGKYMYHVDSSDMKAKYNLYTKQNEFVGTYDSCLEIADFLGKTPNALYMGMRSCKQGKQKSVISNVDGKHYIVRKV